MTFLKSATAVLVPICGVAAHAADGLVVVRSPRSAADTASRLAAAVQARGLKLFARIDHAAGGATVGKTLRLTAVFIFGDPKRGTPLLECAQTAGIELPLKAQVWLGYNDLAWPGLAWTAARHGASSCAVVPNLVKALAGLAAAATAP